MKNKILFILTFSILFISCKNENNQKKIAPVISEIKPEIKSISYKEKAESEIISIISEYENISSVKWNSNQIYKIKGQIDPNENITAFLLNGQLRKMEVTKNLKGLVKISEFYLKDSNLKLVIEKETISNDSITENHFYFNNNKLLKKVINLNYDSLVSKKDLMSEEKRIKKKFDNYAAQIIKEIMSSNK
ncbi:MULTISPECIES: hypothetical protein [unclassified Cellulophaga]|uniref:hypothetical protein n=1 Tax=unclassified Cellulophaga TaxID=2634405 RepID=UPI0026E18400|nr:MULTISPECIES: hypothetical protein [unclassified Cellulophaga]MDO6490105.1 hypothetical protein [Cellulophaga sp. 2_MG-2023]MDO6494701.1 hypothetical protein [Cellulophaga sp. 3_MG-2023]